jgi:hypothetical protein
MTKPLVAFCNYVNAPKNETSNVIGMIVAKQQKYIDEEMIGYTLELVYHSDIKVPFCLRDLKRM